MVGLSRMVSVAEAEYSEVNSRLGEIVGTVENVRFMPLLKKPDEIETLRPARSWIGVFR